MLKNGSKSDKQKKLHVLIVDDDVDLADTVSDILKIEGYKTRVAHSGDEALSAVKDQLPALVLLDIRMGGKSGIETLKAIKEINGEIIVLMMTGSSELKFTEQASRAGASDYILKPIDFVYLKKTLSKFITR